MHRIDFSLHSSNTEFVAPHRRRTAVTYCLYTVSATTKVGTCIYTFPRMIIIVYLAIV